MKKLKINFALIAMIMAATVAFAFKPAPLTKGQRVPVAWYYNAAGTTQAAFQNGNNWGTSNLGSCSTSGTRPCEITVEDITTQGDLSNYLDDFSKDEILNMSPDRKP